MRNPSVDRSIMAVQTFVCLSVNVREPARCIWVNVYWTHLYVYACLPVCTHAHGHTMEDRLDARVISANASLMVTKYQIIVWCAPINGGPSTECYTGKQNQTGSTRAVVKTARGSPMHAGLWSKICTFTVRQITCVTYKKKKKKEVKWLLVCSYFRILRFV